MVTLDSSVVATKTLSPALGAGFHCGFLGLLHMDVFLERLNQVCVDFSKKLLNFIFFLHVWAHLLSTKKEYDMEVMPTAPTVSFRVKVKGEDELITVEIPSEFPSQDQIEDCFEPFVSANIICPDEYLGDVMSLCQVNGKIQKCKKNLSSSLDLTFLFWFFFLIFFFSESKGRA